MHYITKGPSLTFKKSTVAGPILYIDSALSFSMVPSLSIGVFVASLEIGIMYPRWCLLRATIVSFHPYLAMFSNGLKDHMVFFINVQSLQRCTQVVIPIC